MAHLIPFPGNEEAARETVGGKGYALMELSHAGFCVPPGVILTTSFFAPWFESLKSTPSWASLTQADPDGWEPLCDRLRTHGRDLPFTELQIHLLAQLRNFLSTKDWTCYAVRSSSPEEDLAAASFAGGYETRLGVRLGGLEEALRDCFLSSLDTRVFHYKKKHNIELFNPRIAVVIQQQIDSGSAGVGFSINPLTNDYDEAVIDANWGLGESVVAGLATPDHYIVDKVQRCVLDSTLGAKQYTVRLGAERGTVQREDARGNQFALQERDILEITDLMVAVETFYGFPVDIEWAIAEGQLHLLQARPITTYVPLPPEMQTRPGERRKLYSDIALSSGFTINAPISPMGLAWMEESVQSMANLFLGPLNLGLTFDEAFWFFSGSRMYQNLSNMLWLVSPARLSKAAKESDALMSDILIQIDVEKYRSLKRPPWARVRMIKYVPRLLWRLRKGIAATVWAFIAPKRAFATYQSKIAAYHEELSLHMKPERSFVDFRKVLTDFKLSYLFAVMMAALGASLGALQLVDRVVGRKSGEVLALAQKLKRGFEGNVVTEMGIALFKLSKLMKAIDFDTFTQLCRRIEERQMPGDFLEAWDAFMAKYGWRGPSEMDISKPRYADDPMMALKQMSLMPLDDVAYDPVTAHRNQVTARQEAYEALMQRLGVFRRTLLRRLYLIIDLFAGTRDTPKHHNLMVHQIVRERVLQEGNRLVVEGRLDRADQVFDLTFDDLEQADDDRTLDLRVIRAKRTSFQKVLERQVRSFPPVIDSRGRILRPQRTKEKPGEFTGVAVSPGVATGPVKILHDPHEKAVGKGDVLVAYTTDPGWTPLFANACAVVLEIGGVLQHGAVVAREYGKPCVVGIDQVTTRLEDGQHIEVDGTTGIVRFLDR